MVSSTKVLKPPLKDLVLFLIMSFYYIIEALFLTILPDRWRTLKNISGRNVLITGGAGGLGRLLALYFARKGATVIVWDINKQGLDETCTLLAKEGLKAHPYTCDVSDRAAIYRTAEVVQQECGAIDILVNNAAVVTCRTLLEIPDHMIQRTFNVNIMSNYWTTKAFLPEMISRKTGHIVTVSSVTGLLGTYGCTDYSATKFAAVGFHESLYTELRTHGHDNIHLTLVCPSYINTGMFSGVQPRYRQMLEPEYVAERIITSICKNEVNCTLPNAVRILLPLKCLLPAKLCWELMYKVLQGPQSMMTFKGNNFSTRSDLTAQG